MAANQELRKIARETAEQAQARVTHLEQEVFDLETRLAEKKVECDAARLAPQRLTNYPVTLGAHYTCPRCWIESETRSPLRGIPSTTRDDIFRCRQCGSDFTILG